MLLYVSPPAIVVSIQTPAPAQQPSQQLPVPQVDLAVEVVGKLPMQAKLHNLSRLLGLRQASGSFNRRYPPTILELITLVERNPERPRGRNWDSIHALTILHHPEPGHVLVEYCIDNCEFDPQTGFHPRRKMVSYRATEAAVEQRLDKKLRELRRFER